MKARYACVLVLVVFLIGACSSSMVPKGTLAPASTPIALPAETQSAVTSATGFDATAQIPDPDAGRATVGPVPPTATPVVAPTETADASAQLSWQVETLLVAPGESGRLYALLKDSSGPLWAFPAASVGLIISDDFAVTWAPFPGGLPVPASCMVNVNLDYAAVDALYASTCQGLYVWDAQGQTWAKRSDRLTNFVVVAYGQPESVWAAALGDGVIRSSDGGRTWQDASTDLVTFGGMANLGLDPRDNSTLYGIIRPQYAGSYLRRGTADGRWQTMPTPLDDAAIETGMTVDGATGALYVSTQVAPVGLWRSLNPNTPDVADVQWELVHDLGANVQLSLLASGWSPQGLAIYANMWPLTPLAGGGAGVGSPVLHRSLDGGHTWEPLTTP